MITSGPNLAGRIRPHTRMLLVHYYQNKYIQYKYIEYNILQIILQYNKYNKTLKSVSLVCFEQNNYGRESTTDYL